jgi:hypothetical protein
MGQGANTASAAIPLHGLAAGTYVIELHTAGDGLQRAAFIKQ